MVGSFPVGSFPGGSFLEGSEGLDQFWLADEGVFGPGLGYLWDGFGEQELEGKLGDCVAGQIGGGKLLQQVGWILGRDSSRGTTE